MDFDVLVFIFFSYMAYVETSERLLSPPPIPHAADETANRRFKRAVRVKKDQPKDIAIDDI